MGHLLTTLQNKKIPVKDGFNRDDSNSTMGSANTGQVWTPQSGTWGISGNNAYLVTTPGADYVTVIDSKAGNVIIRDSIADSAPGSNFNGIVFRLTDDSNYLLFVIKNTTASMYKRDSGAFTLLATAVFTLSANIEYQLTVKAAGNSIQTYINGVLTLAYTLVGGETTSYSASKTKHGLHSHPPDASTTCRHDKFEIELF